MIAIKVKQIRTGDGNHPVPDVVMCTTLMFVQKYEDLSSLKVSFINAKLLKRKGKIATAILSALSSFKACFCRKTMPPLGHSEIFN